MRHANRQGTAMPLLGPHETRWHETLCLLAIMKRVALAIGVELFSHLN